ncbi:MAG: DsbA family protein [Lautropia sp.]|nr:DsbA family protein [Lautropia sp.]
MKRTLTYLFDPLCGWCYGAGAPLARIISSTGVNLELLPSGLFSGHGARPMDEAMASHAWSTDQRIETLTGQPFSIDYLTQVLCNRHQPLDSTAATLALTAVAQTEPAREFETLQHIQHARYVGGKNITERHTLINLLDALGLFDAANALRVTSSTLLNDTQQRIDRACALMNEMDVHGVPCFVMTHDNTRRTLPASMLFAQPMHFTRQIYGISEAELDNLL